MGLQGAPEIRLRSDQDRAVLCAGVACCGCVEAVVMRRLTVAYLVTAWLLVPYPYGFWLFVFGAACHWTLQRFQKLPRRDLYPIPLEPRRQGARR